MFHRIDFVNVNDYSTISRAHGFKSPILRRNPTNINFNNPTLGKIR